MNKKITYLSLALSVIILLQGCAPAEEPKQNEVVDNEDAFEEEINEPVLDLQKQKEEDREAYDNAMNTKNSEDCIEIQDPNLEKTCKNNLIWQEATENKDTEKCEELEDKDLIEECKAEVQ